MEFICNLHAAFLDETFTCYLHAIYMSFTCYLHRLFTSERCDIDEANEMAMLPIPPSISV